MSEQPKINIKPRDNRSIKISPREPGAPRKPFRFPWFPIATGLCIVAIGSVLFKWFYPTDPQPIMAEELFRIEPIFSAQEASLTIRQADNNPPDLDLKQFSTELEVLSHDYSLRDFLETQNVPSHVVSMLAEQAENMGMKKLKAGQELKILNPKNANDNEYPRYVYDISSSQYAFIDPRFDDPKIEIKKRNIIKKMVAAGGIIKTTFWEAVLDNDLNYRIVPPMEEMLKWSVDLFHLEPGDRFKVIYEEYIADGRSIGVGKVEAIQFQCDGSLKYALVMPDGNFYNEKGNPLRNTFLKSPVKYGRISSHYNPERIHPILGIKRPHLGTDYAAPEGAPVYSVADGVVEIASFSKNNGNYIKIKHDNNYQTQYLHLSAFHNGIQEGAIVQQGQEIGKVGSTGLATGPHVCFRFWKDGRQIDHTKEELATGTLSSAYAVAFSPSRRDSLLSMLKEIRFTTVSL